MRPIPFPAYYIYTIFLCLPFFDTWNPHLIPQCRALIADFAIIISIMVFCALDHLMSLETPKLHVPTEIKVTQLSFSVISLPLKKILSLIPLPLLKWIWNHECCSVVCSKCSSSLTLTPWVWLYVCYLYFFLTPFCKCVASETHQWFCHLHINHDFCWPWYFNGAWNT